MDFLTLESVEDKYKEFCELVVKYVIPGIEEDSTLSPSVIKDYVEEALDEIAKQNYEGIFLVGKTPKKVQVVRRYYIKRDSSCQRFSTKV